MKSCIARCLSGESAHYEGNYPRNNSDPESFIKSDFHPVHSSNDTVLGGIWIYQGISSCKRTQAKPEVLGQQRRDLAVELLAAAEEERKRLGGEIHDNISSSLAAIRMLLSKALSKTKQGLLATEDLQQVIAMTKATSLEVRRIITDLHPAVLDDFGIEAAMHWLCQEMKESHPTLHLTMNFDMEEDRVPDPAGIPP